MNKFILSYLLLNSCTFATDINLLEEQQDNNLALHKLFPSYPSQSIQKILQEESIVPIPIQSGKDVGFNMPRISTAHFSVLQQCPNQKIIEFGPGSGYFMAKLLAAGAQHVTGVELSPQAAQQIPFVIQKYELNPGTLQRKYTIINADVIADQFKAMKSLTQKYDQIIGFNFLHYLTPLYATLFLSNVTALADNNTTFTFSMNAPSGDKLTVNNYKKQDINNQYPGYILQTRVDTQLYEAHQKCPIKLIKKIGTEYKDVKSLSLTDNISPSELKIVGQPSFTSLTPTTIEAKITLQKSLFMWDKKTAERIFPKAGLKIQEIYYLDDFNHKHKELDLEKAKTQAFNLVVIAKKQA